MFVLLISFNCFLFVLFLFVYHAGCCCYLCCIFYFCLCFKFLYNANFCFEILFSFFNLGRPHTVPPCVCRYFKMENSCQLPYEQIRSVFKVYLAKAILTIKNFLNAFLKPTLHQVYITS